MLLLLLPLGYEKGPGQEARGPKHCQGLVGAATVAGELFGEGGQLAGEEGLHGIAHSGELAGKVDVNAHLPEAHEGPEAHAASEQNLHAMACQMLHGSKAATLLMGNVFQSGDVFDCAVFDLDNGVDVAVAEVHAHACVKAARHIGRNSEKCAHIAFPWPKGLAHGPPEMIWGWGKGWQKMPAAEYASANPLFFVCGGAFFVWG